MKPIYSFALSMLCFVVFGGTGLLFGYHWTEENHTNIIFLLLTGIVYCVLTNVVLMKMPSNKEIIKTKMLLFLQIAITTYAIAYCISMGFIIGYKETHENFTVPSNFGGFGIIMILLLMFFQRKTKAQQSKNA